MVYLKYLLKLSFLYHTKSCERVRRFLYKCRFTRLMGQEFPVWNSFLFITRIKKLTAIITGNKRSDFSNETYFMSRECTKGMRTPPIGIANFMTPIAVPDIFL